MGDFFDDLVAGQQAAQAQSRAERQLALEDAAVKQALRSGGYAGDWRNLYQDCQERTGSRRLSCEWFREYYPGFPVHFGASVIDWLHQMDVWELFDRFLKTKLFKAYLEFSAQSGVDDTNEHLAMVFRWKRRLMVLHNFTRIEGLELLPTSARDDDEAPGGACLLYRGGVPVMTYALERWSSVLNRLGKAWCET